MNELGQLINLPKIIDPRGNLTVAQAFEHVPSGESRGGHAHYKCREFIIAVSGSFDVCLDNGQAKKTYHLNHPYQGLLIDTNIWRTLEDFSSGAVCLVLAEDDFDEKDYIYDYQLFLSHLKCLK